MIRSEPSSCLQPLAAEKRMTSLDSMRGFALFGILFVNITWFSGFAVLDGESRAAFSTALLDEKLYWWIHLLVDGKFWSLFALMFGVGIAIQIQRAEQKNFGVKRFLCRRLLVLFAIGMLHGIFLWFGDIISLYALTGFALLWLHRCSNRVLLALAFVFLLLPIIQTGIWLGIVSAIRDPGENLAASGHGPGELLVYFESGSFINVFYANGAFLKERWVLAVYEGRFFKLLGMMLMGMFAYRALLKDSAQINWRLLLSIGGFAGCLGLAGNALLAEWSGQVTTRPPTIDGWVFSAIQSFAVPALCIAYATAFFCAATAWPTFLVTKMFALVGRMSLTHYLFQSFVGVVVFYGWGFSWWGNLGLTGAILFAILLFILQAIFSFIWLQSFEQGPLEWLSRQAVYRLYAHPKSKEPTGRSTKPALMRDVK